MYMKYKERVSTIILVMALASLSVIIPLVIFENVIAVFILYYIGMCLIVPFVDLILIRRIGLNDAIRLLGFAKANIKISLFVGLLHGITIFVFTICGFVIFEEVFVTSDIATSLEQWGVSENIRWIIFILMVLFNGIVEEIFWRGYTYGKIRNQLNKWFAIFIVTFFYSSYHLATVFTFFKISYISIQIVLFIFAAGLIWGWMRYRFNNIWASVIGHTLVTIGYMTIYLLL